MRNQTDEVIGISKWIIGGVLAISVVGCGLGVITGAIGTTGRVASTPAQVVDRVVNPDNILNSYQQFYQLNARFESRIQDIKNQQELLDEETDPRQKRVYQQNLLGMRSVCNDMVQKYNASAQSKVSGWFRDNSLPSTLDPDQCNGKQ